MQILKIKANQTLNLRNTILRPGLDLAQCEYVGDNDDSTHHLGCVVDNELVGIVSIYERSNSAVHSGCGFQIRAMATCDTVRGKGMGLSLLKAAEQTAFNSGAKYIWANARASAIGFYKKAGYQIGHEEFQIEGVGAHFVVCLPRAQKNTGVTVRANDGSMPY
jgi:GNAT superfamily N-acetyltransferase